MATLEITRRTAMTCSATGWGFIAFIYQNLGTISLVCAAMSGAAYVAFCVIKDRKLELSPTVAKMTAGFVLPAALAMAASSFDPKDFLACVNDLPLYILVGSTSVVWITMSVLFPDSAAWRFIRMLGRKVQPTTSNEQQPKPPSTP
jgi:hypothetical protein